MMLPFHKEEHWFFLKKKLNKTSYVLLQMGQELTRYPLGYLLISFNRRLSFVSTSLLTILFFANNLIQSTHALHEAMSLMLRYLSSVFK